MIGGLDNDTISGGGGADFIIAGQDNDFVLFSGTSALTEAVKIDGGSGTDTIAILGQFTGLDNSFANVTGVEVLSLAGNANSVTLGETAKDADIVSVVGGPQSDSFTTTSTINFNIDGAEGKDTLSLTTAGVVNDFSKLTSIEALKLADGANTVNLGSSAADIQTLTGGTGKDNFNAAGYTTSIVLQGWSGSASDNTSDDTLTGGTSADTFVLGDSGANGYGQGMIGSPVAFITNFQQGTDNLILWGQSGKNELAYSVSQVGTTKEWEILDTINGEIVSKVTIEGTSLDLTSNVTWL
jgi:hypothetical protein